MADKNETSRVIIDEDTPEISYVGNKPSDITVKVDVDISEALTGLKALQREAKKATQELKTLEDVNNNYLRYKQAINDIAVGYKADIETQQRLRLTNKIVFEAYNGYDRLKYVELIFPRCSGATTSAIALERVFDDVVYLNRHRQTGKSIKPNFTVITDDGYPLPRGIRCAKHICIKSLDKETQVAR